MHIPRDNLLAKIRGLLSKTTSNGCTEEEALSALSKARAMMDAYEVTEADLSLTAKEAAVLSDPSDHDPHGIHSGLARAIAKFCECRVWRRANGSGLVFCGLPSDTQLATWLLGSLTGFVQAELTDHLIFEPSLNGQRRHVIAGFVAGITARISRRLIDLYEASKRAATSNSQALVVVKTHLIARKMNELGIHLRKSSGSSRRQDSESYNAGKCAGDRASFGRPVGSSTAGSPIGLLGSK